MNKYHIVKHQHSYPIYRVINTATGDIVKEFDAYNHQKPYSQAKEYIKDLQDDERGQTA